MPTLFIDREKLDAAASLLRSMGATEVYVFGSATKGDMRPDSDVDIAVRGLPYTKYFRAVAKTSRILKRDVDLVDLDEEIGPILKYIMEQGELLRVA